MTSPLNLYNNTLYNDQSTLYTVSTSLNTNPSLKRSERSDSSSLESNASSSSKRVQSKRITLRDVLMKLPLNAKRYNADFMLAQTETVRIFEQGSWSQIANYYIKAYRDSEEPVMIIDLGVLLDKWREWEVLLPNVKPFYAVKSNDDPVILKVLSVLGAGFDCATVKEIEMVRSLPGVRGEDIIYGNPCKSKASISFARKVGVKKMTFDCVNELEKIKQVFPDAEVVLRVKVDDTGALCRLGSKFGALPSECEELIEKCDELDLNLIGISFHVGSGQKRAKAYIDALNVVSELFEKVKTEYGFDLRFLDIGGGFPGFDEQNLKFAKMAENISECITDLFPNCTIIAEPGRYFSSSCATLLTKITTKKVWVDENGEKFFKYYINDGVYASFNNVLYDYYEPVPKFHWSVNTKTPKYLSTVYGPTCDSLDTVLREYPMPELQVDNFIWWENMGAYTSCAASSFNGCPVAKTVYVYRENN